MAVRFPEPSSLFPVCHRQLTYSLRLAITIVLGISVHATPKYVSPEG